VFKQRLGWDLTAVRLKKDSSQGKMEIAWGIFTAFENYKLLYISKKSLPQVISSQRSELFLLVK